MTYASDVRNALADDRGVDIMLQLMSLLESYDIPVRGISIDVKVPPRVQREHIGTFFGTVDVAVTT